jgi:hypothetical protein
MSFVSGMLFKVEDFEKWLYAYHDASEGLIIGLRNVDDPKLALIFEGANSMDILEGRVSKLSSESFLSTATSVGEPFSSFYKIEYVTKAENPPKTFFALSFTAENSLDWIAWTEKFQDYFMELNLETAGIGTNPEDPLQVYILFRLNDFVEFRKNHNSPRKVDRLLENLSLPRNTLLSYWIRINE